MTPALLLIATAGIGANLLWLAFFCLVALAIVLYVPRRFSGPLTDHERRAVRGGFRHRTLAVVLAAPLATLSGFLLLLPPLVILHVPTHPTATSWHEARTMETTWWAHFAWTESTSGWIRSVECEIRGGDHDEEALAAAILSAARGGFNERDCPRPDLDTWALASIELSLIEVAARAYMLTDVVMMVGPRMQEPDPWDIMARTLEKRGITPHFTGRGALETNKEDAILRLTRARVIDRPNPLDVFALVQGNLCPRDRTGKLISPDGSFVDSCKLSAPAACNEQVGIHQRMLLMEVRCDKFTEQADFLESNTGLLLSADYGETPVRVNDQMRAITVQVNDEAGAAVFERALEMTAGGGAFAEELKRRTLRPLERAQNAAISLEIGDDILILGPQRNLAHCEYTGGDGPFSWQGIDGPKIEVGSDRVKISGPGLTLNPDVQGYDPTTFYALMSTITWAANALESGICGEREEPPRSTSRRPAYPLLTAQEIESAATALGRPRESLGLVLLALAVLALALGLRRSVN